MIRRAISIPLVLRCSRLVTGQVPFDGDSTVSVAMKHLQEEITPPSEIVPDIPYSLEQIILESVPRRMAERQL